jgi:hypothetical protein
VPGESCIAGSRIGAGKLGTRSAGRKGAKPASSRRPVVVIDALRKGQFGRIQWDEFSRKNFRERDSRRVELDKVEITRLLEDMGSSGLVGIRRRDLEDAIELVAHDDPFDAMQDWLDQLPPWDGVIRVPTFLSRYMGTKQRKFTDAVGRYLWTAMVARLLCPGCKADMVPVLVGSQGDGKTEILKLLAPRPDCWAEVRLSDPSARLLRKTIGRTLLVWEELRGIRGTVDADEVKTFITNDHVDLLRSNGSVFDKLPRRFIIFGTSNRYEFLRDTTGHRRYLPFEVGRIDHQGLKSDSDMLWAEALHEVKARLANRDPPVDFRDAEKLARAEFARFERRGEWADCDRLDAWIGRQGGTPFSTEEALSQSGVTGTSSMTPKAAARQMALSLRQLGCTEKRVAVPGNNNRLKRWVRTVSGHGGRLPASSAGAGKNIRARTRVSSEPVLGGEQVTLDHTSVPLRSGLLPEKP